jgi:hypothetical protein
MSSVLSSHPSSQLPNSTTMHTPSQVARSTPFGGALFIGTTPSFFGSSSNRC